MPLILLHGSEILIVPAGFFFAIAFLLLGFIARKGAPKMRGHLNIQIILAVIFAFAGLVCFLIALDEIKYMIKYSFNW
jgi:hypothetical protein